jgi:AcrR family transcriptional regulator
MGTRMRADAQRNRSQILRAAREIFVASGPDAPLDEIARRAGVGIATLDRRFPRREDLIHSVAIDTLTEMDEVLERIVEQEPDLFEALRRFMHAAIDLRVGAIMPTLSGRFDIETVAAAGDPVMPLEQLVDRAKEAGVLRGDVLIGDIALMVIRLSRPLPAGDIPEDRGIAHRQLEIFIDGLRPVAAQARAIRLPEPAIGGGWFRSIRKRIAAGGRRGA